jgi:hypothetical protein
VSQLGRHSTSGRILATRRYTELPLRPLDASRPSALEARRFSLFFSKSGKICFNVRQSWLASDEDARPKGRDRRFYFGGHRRRHHRHRQEADSRRSLRAEIRAFSLKRTRLRLYSSLFESSSCIWMHGCWILDELREPIIGRTTVEPNLAQRFRVISRSSQMRHRERT